MSDRDISDIEELFNVAVQEAAKPERNERIPLIAKGTSRKDMAGGLNQWSNVNGKGYIATTDTTKILPSACYRPTWTPDGALIFLKQDIVTDKLLRLPDSRSDEVIKEVENFWTLKDTFKKYGFAHKRGFLLYGPPGSGKTSTIAIIMSDMIRHNGLVMLADNPASLTAGLAQLRTVEPERPVVVIMEDIDTIIRDYGENQVLSVLDGEAQIENVVYVATTNYPENLNGRIINRPSRFDRVMKINTPNAEARAMYLKTKIDNLVVDGYDLVKETDGLSIAHLKELIVALCCLKTPTKEIIQRLQRMKYTPKSSDGEGKLGF